MTLRPGGQQSPPMRVLLGVLIVEVVVSVGTLAWNAVDWIRHRRDFDR